MKRKGRFVISLDFELIWGVLDLKDLGEYKPNIIGVRKAIPDILATFEENSIHATWAVVGIMALEGVKDINKYAPDVLPQYINPKVSSYNHITEISEDEEKLYFGNDLVQLIKKTPHQELGCHTFSHYYCNEDGADIESFKADLIASKKVMKTLYDVDVTSIVFPRNQALPKYVEAACECGFKVWRGNPKGFKVFKNKFARTFQRILRMIDTYIPIYGNLCDDLPSDSKNMVCLKSSRFFRPYSNKLYFLEGVKLWRIKKQMEYAAKHDKVFHLWWHPHNFGSNTQKMLEQLKDILSYYQFLHKKYGFKSCSMNELNIKQR